MACGGLTECALELRNDWIFYAKTSQTRQHMFFEFESLALRRHVCECVLEHMYKKKKASLNQIAGNRKSL